LAKLFENWRKYINEVDDPDSDADDAAELRDIASDIDDEKFFGSCGMFAIALGEEAIKRGKEVVMVVAHNAKDLKDLEMGEPDVYHVAVEIDGTIYDGRGKVSSVDDLLDFMGDTPAKIDYLALDEAFKTMVRRQTNWKTTCEEYAKEAGQFLNKLGGENETPI